MTARLTPIRGVSLPAISSAVAATFSVTPDDLHSESRRSDFLKPRQIAMYLAHSKAHFNLCAIGRHFRRTHATVIHAVDKVGQEYRANAEYAAYLDNLWSVVLMGSLSSGARTWMGVRLAELESTLRTIESMTETALRAVAALRREVSGKAGAA